MNIDCNFDNERIPIATQITKEKAEKAKGFAALAGGGGAGDGSRL